MKKLKLIVMILVMNITTIVAQNQDGYFLFQTPENFGRIVPIEINYPKINDTNQELLTKQLVLIGYMKIFFSDSLSIKNIKMGNYIFSIRIDTLDKKISIKKFSIRSMGENSFVSWIDGTKKVEASIGFRRIKKFPDDNTDNQYSYENITKDEANDFLMDEIKYINDFFSTIDESPLKNIAKKTLKEREKKLKKLKIKKEVIYL